MDITRDEAALALSDIERTAGRARTLNGYRHASPHLILWGLIWAVGYGGMAYLPQAQWGWLWLGLDVVGVAGSAIIGSRMRSEGSSRHARRTMGAAATAAALIFATVVLFRGAPTEAFMAFPALLTGAIYVVIGLWGLTRMIWIGAIMFAATLVGYAVLEPWFALWMALVGGGGLILGGLWLRRA